MFAVVNHLHLSVPAAEILPTIRREFPPVFDGLPGFHSFQLVQTAEDRVIVIILWASGAEAQQGASVIGPGLFNKYVAPYLASEQQRSVGPVVVQHPG